ncbi:MAG: GTPase HflX [Methanotrichaceae archaeon]
MMPTKTAVLLMRENPRDDHNPGKMEELEGLARSAGYTILAEIVQCRNCDRKFQLGKGKIAQATAYHPDKLIFYNPLSPGQMYNISKEFEIPMIDRFNLILEIFASRAFTREAKLQVELARLTYEVPFVRTMESLRKLSERSGYRGSGSYDLSMYQDIRGRIAKIKAELKSVEKRGSARRQRRRNLGFDLVALAGYTNAGKSTIFNILTEETVKAKDQLFTTLSPTTRAVRTKERNFLLTDTVGFIDDLPLFLIKAFRSTLAEIVQADLVLLVVDLSDLPQILRKKLVACHDVLWDCNCYAPIITVLNKVDKLTEEEEASSRQSLIQDLTPNPIVLSAKENKGLDDLVNLVLDRLPLLKEFTIKLPYTEEGMSQLSRLYKVADLLEVSYGEEIEVKLKGREDLVIRAMEQISTDGVRSIPAVGRP